MVDKELISFLKEKYPQNVIGLSNIIDMLVSEIDVILDQNLKNSSSVSKNRNFEEAILYLKKAQDIDSVKQKLLAFNNDLKENIISSVQVQKEPDQKDKEQAHDVIDVKSNKSDSSEHAGIIVDLNVDTIGRQPYQFQIKDKVLSVSGWRDLYVKTCEYFADLDVEKFTSYIGNPGVNGKVRLYFSSEGGKNMVNPRKIRGANIIIETALPLTKTKRLIQTMLEDYGIDSKDYKIYI